MKRTLALILLATLSIGSAFSQQSQRWRNERHSVYAGLGINNFMGDLAGGKGDAAHFFGLKDFKFSDTRPAATIGWRYRIFEPLSVRVDFTYAMMHADDSKSKNENRELRNLMFRSNTFDIGAKIDYYFLKEKEVARYSAFTRGSFFRNLSAYVFVGIGGLHFNPKAKIDGSWVELQPLHTEGQGTGYVYSTYINEEGEAVKLLDEDGKLVTIDPGKEYKLWALSIPIGLGVKYRLTKKLAISLEISNHYTSTDYLDDAKSDYYFNYNDPGVVAAGITPPSDLTMRLADRHLVKDDAGNKVEHTTDYHLGQMKRGDSSYNDAYIVTLISLHYKFANVGKNAKPKYN